MIRYLVVLTFEIYSKSNHFSPPLLLAFSCRTQCILTWIVTKLINLSVCLHPSVWSILLKVEILLEHKENHKALRVKIFQWLSYLIQDSYVTLTGKSLTKLLYRLLGCLPNLLLNKWTKVLDKWTRLQEGWSNSLTLIREGKECTKPSKIDFLWYDLRKWNALYVRGQEVEEKGTPAEGQAMDML